MLDGAVQIIGSSLLGLTLQCARCHDHKFEPVTQKEYYQLQAILYPAFNVEKWVKPNDRVVAAAPRRLVAPWEAHEKKVDAEVARLKTGVRTQAERPAQGERGQAEARSTRLSRRRTPGAGRTRAGSPGWPTWGPSRSARRS